jgi:hypothetical protein
LKSSFQDWKSPSKSQFKHLNQRMVSNANSCVASSKKKQKNRASAMLQKLGFFIDSFGLMTNRQDLKKHYAAGAAGAGAGGAGAAGAGAAGAAAGAGGTAAPVLMEPASTVVPQELQPAAGTETVTVTASPQPQLGAGAGAAQPQLGAGAAQPQLGAGAASQPQLGAGAAQPQVGAGAGQHVGAGAGSQHEGAPLHLLAIFALILAINPPPWQDACFLACNFAKMPCRPQQLLSPPQPAIANELLRANATANASEANRTLII